MEICAADEEPPLTYEHAKYKLVMVRHGQSESNVADVFGGWHDFDLTDTGETQAQIAGITLRKRGFNFDVAISSFLRRASKTRDLIIEQLGQCMIEKYETWRLNERHSGLVCGLNHGEVKDQYGDEMVRKWRYGNVRPPPMTPEHRYFKAITERDPRYGLDPEFFGFPSSESFEDTVLRVVPYWENVIIPQLKAGKRILVVGHTGIFRALVYHWEALTEEQLPKVRTPNATPFVYEFDENMKVIMPRKFLTMKSTMENNEIRPHSSASPSD